MEIKPFEKKVWLATPTMHGEEQQYVKAAFDANWITTAGENINELDPNAFIIVHEGLQVTGGFEKRLVR